MSHADEVVRWTQAMQLDGNVLVFEVVDGSSTTWGSFGGEGYLRATVDTDLPHLNGYAPEASVNGSGVGFAANRVHHLVLKRVRVFLSNGEVLEDSTERVVFSQQ
jgi:hypothetical protein